MSIAYEGLKRLSGVNGNGTLDFLLTVPEHLFWDRLTWMLLHPFAQYALCQFLCFVPLGSALNLPSDVRASSVPSVRSEQRELGHQALQTREAGQWHENRTDLPDGKLDLMGLAGQHIWSDGQLTSTLLSTRSTEHLRKS
jgi:hypothetical protein